MVIPDQTMAALRCVLFALIVFSLPAVLRHQLVRMVRPDKEAFHSKNSF